MLKKLKKLILFFVISLIMIPLLPSNISYATDYINPGTLQYISGTTEKEFYLNISGLSYDEYVFETDVYQTSCDTKITLYKKVINHQQQEEWEIIHYDDDSGISLYSKINIILTPGEYKIKVNEYSGGSLNCVLRVDNLSWTPSMNFGSTYIISAIPYKEYKIKLLTSGKYKFETNYNSQNSDTFLLLYDKNHNYIMHDDDGGNGYYSKIEYSLQYGTYYLKVREYDHAINVNC